MTVPVALREARKASRLNGCLRRLAMALLSACQYAAPDYSDEPAEQYGFVTRLGQDTIAVERVSRSAHRLVTDGVDRFPLVRVRHSEFTLDDEGHITRMVMDIRTPSGATPTERFRRVTTDERSGRLHIEIADSSGIRDTSFTTGGLLTVPHVSMMYSVIELEIASAMRASADSTGRIRFRQYYPDRNIGPSFAFHQGFVRPLGEGKVELRHDWLSGFGDVVMDSAGRMQQYSGHRSTYLVDVTRTADAPDVQVFAERMTAAERTGGATQLSVRDSVHSVVGDAVFDIDYGRPLARGRQLLGDVITYGAVWRTGANAATQMTVSVPVTIGTLRVPAGKYTLWTVPRADGVDLLVNAQSGQWGTQYDRGRDIGRTAMQTATAADTVQRFTIAVEPDGARRGQLRMAWGTFRWSVPIEVHQP